MPRTILLIVGLLLTATTLSGCYHRGWGWDHGRDMRRGSGWDRR